MILLACLRALAKSKEDLKFRMYESIVLILFFIIIISLTVYQFIPEIVVKYLGLGSWKRQYSPGVSLTFDDGPDPRYTPLLLNILKKNKYPHLVKSIYDDGHIIGSHGYCHQHAWTMSPLKTWRSWDKSIAEIRRAIGEETQFIRSPWGSINLALIIWCLLKKKRIVSWNATGKDWRRNNTPESIISKISQRMAEGSIVLLHDSGGEQGAPDNTIACIEQLCRHIREVHKLPIIGLQFPTWSVFRRLKLNELMIITFFVLV